nr:MAG TPA: hypothetical protein [Bacteriophage sp.]
MFYNRLFIMNYSISLFRRLYYFRKLDNLFIMYLLLFLYYRNSYFRFFNNFFLFRNTYRNRNGLRILDS